mgnify:CR=1 FL=1
MSSIRIDVSHDGPYLVTGLTRIPRRAADLADDGFPSGWTELADVPVDAAASRVALCRCGGTQRAPFCDGTHKRIGFDGTDVASHESYDAQATVREGRDIDMGDAVSLCAHAKFCQRHGDAWHLLHVDSGDGAGRAELVEMIDLCPTGRLTHRDKGTSEWQDPDLPEEVFLVQNGPICMTGGVALHREDGATVDTRNRIAVCRCGHSANKPYCDGTHLSVGYTDRIEASTNE